MRYSQFQLENWKVETMINKVFNCSVCLLFVFLALQPIVVVFSQLGSGL
jgi:hypothetical protein